MKHPFLTLITLIALSSSSPLQASWEAATPAQPPIEPMRYSYLYSLWERSTFQNLDSLSGQNWKLISFATNRACASQGQDRTDYTGLLNIDNSQTGLEFSPLPTATGTQTEVTLLNLGRFGINQGPYLFEPRNEVQFSQWAYSGDELNDREFFTNSCKLVQVSSYDGSYWLICAMSLKLTPNSSAPLQDLQCATSEPGIFSVFSYGI